MEQQERRRSSGWVTVIMILIAVVVSTWIGVGIGRGVEAARTRQLLGNMTNDVAKYQEVVKDIAALEDMVSGKDKMLNTLFAIRTHYVDPINIDTLYEKAIPALLSELDPHSEYRMIRGVSAPTVKSCD